MNGSNERPIASSDGANESSERRATSAHHQPKADQHAYQDFEEPTLRLAGGLLVVVPCTATCVLIWWLGWSSSLYLASWFFTSAMAFAAVFAAWSAFASQCAKRRPALLLVAAGLGVITFAGYSSLTGGLSPPSEVSGPPPQEPLGPIARQPSKETRATLEYWNVLREATASVDKAPSCAKRRTYSELISCLASISNTCSNAAEKVEAASVRDVDAEVNDLGAQYVLLFHRASAYFDRTRSILTDRKNLGEYAVSPEVMVESALRGFLGDPLGKSNEIQQSNRQLGAEFNAAQRELHDLRQVAAALSAESHRVRGAMSAKYDLDLPALD